MRLAADLVGDHRGQLHRWIELLEAQHDGGRAPRLRLRVEHQDDWRIQPLRHLGGRALLAQAVEPVEAPHHPFDEREVGVAGVAGHGSGRVVAPAHPAVEVVGSAARHDLVKPGIDEVGANLEGLDREPAPAKGLEQCERDGGLADAARHATDDEETSRSSSRRTHPRPHRLPRAPRGHPGRV